MQTAFAAFLFVSAGCIFGYLLASLLAARQRQELSDSCNEVVEDLHKHYGEVATSVREYSQTALDRVAADLRREREQHAAEILAARTTYEADSQRLLARNADLSAMLDGALARGVALAYPANDGSHEISIDAADALEAQRYEAAREQAERGQPA